MELPLPPEDRPKGYKQALDAAPMWLQKEYSAAIKEFTRTRDLVWAAEKAGKTVARIMEEEQVDHDKAAKAVYALNAKIFRPVDVSRLRI